MAVVDEQLPGRGQNRGAGGGGLLHPAYAYIEDVPIGEDLYRRIIDNVGPDPLPGSLLHLCVRQPDGRLRYLDVWESEQACGEAFEQRIHPAVDAAFGGQRPAGEPQVHRLELLHATGSWLAARP